MKECTPRSILYLRRAYHLPMVDGSGIDYEVIWIPNDRAMFPFKSYKIFDKMSVDRMLIIG